MNGRRTARIRLAFLGGYWTVCINGLQVMSFAEYKPAWEAAYDLLTA